MNKVLDQSLVKEFEYIKQQDIAGFLVSKIYTISVITIRSLFKNVESMFHGITTTSETVVDDNFYKRIITLDGDITGEIMIYLNKDIDYENGDGIAHRLNVFFRADDDVLIDGLPESVKSMLDPAIETIELLSDYITDNYDSLV